MNIKLHNLRAGRGITQEEVAQAVGCKQCEISNYERGLVPVDTRVQHRIARYYGVEAAEIWPASLILGEEESKNE